MPDILTTLAAIVAAIAIAFGVVALIGQGVHLAARKWPILEDLRRRARRPLRLLVSSVAVAIAIALTTEPADWWPSINHVLVIILIISVAWLFAQVALIVEQAIDAQHPIDVEDNQHARRVQTQVEILRRLVTVAIVIIAIAGIMFTFPGMRAVGASILASAGLVSIIAGLAAQTSLANIFAGMQIAFTDALRVDDVVVVEGEWGRIEEITMTYVVVKIWDDRRLVLPSTYFTSTPFKNWTRESSELLGSVELDVDWTVPIEGLRAEMDRLLAVTDLWDGRVGIIQITDATGGTVKVRALTSAASGPILWDLRCYLREGLVIWMQRQRTGLPRTRYQALPPTTDAGPDADTSGGGRPSSAEPRRADDTGGLGLFTGTAEADARARDIAGRSSGHTGEIRVRERGEGGGAHGNA